jgi:Na+/melibiose symporter-like transporter
MLNTRFKKMSNVKLKAYLQILSRSVAAIAGGYVLSNLLATFTSYLLPMPTADSVLLSLQLSFLFYSIVIIWVFSVKTAGKAWLGILISCAISALILYLAMPESSI